MKTIEDNGWMICRKDGLEKGDYFCFLRIVRYVGDNTLRIASDDSLPASATYYETKERAEKAINSLMVGFYDEHGQYSAKKADASNYIAVEVACKYEIKTPDKM